MRPIVALLLAAAPAAASTPFALLRPETVAAATSLPDVVAAADAALARAPRARAALHTEGTLPGHGIREASLWAKEDQSAILALATTWRTTGQRRYLDGAARYLQAWAAVYRPSFNPIDETGFDQMLMATDLVRADLSPAARARVDGLWRRTARGYLDAMDGKPTHGRTNWQSHRVKLATLAAYAVGDPALVARARAAFQRQVAANIRPNGSVYDFAERDALHYVTYDLDPLLVAALAARAHGEDWYGWRTPAGAGLAPAVAWLEPYALGTRAHVEFARSRIKFDSQRAAAGQREYAPHRWDRRNAVSTYALAAPFDARWGELATRLADETGRAPPFWTSFLR